VDVCNSRVVGSTDMAFLPILRILGVKSPLHSQSPVRTGLWRVVGNPEVENSNPHRYLVSGTLRLVCDVGRIKHLIQSVTPRCLDVCPSIQSGY